MGFHTHESFFNCYRCGYSTIWDVVSRLTRENPREVILRYSNGDAGGKKHRRSLRGQGPTLLSMPLGCSDIRAGAEAYLSGRNFDVDNLVEEWGLRMAPHTGNYKFRIIAPIFYNHQMVSFQGRDYTGKSELKYKACPIPMEIRHHKDILYGLDKCKGDSIVITEGITDVWRLGPGAVCTFGIKFKAAQVQEIARRGFRRIHILFDWEEFAYYQAVRLASMLGINGMDAVVHSIMSEGMDPGAMKEDDAQAFMRSCLK